MNQKLWILKILYSFYIPPLRLLGSAGEPINPEVWQWYYEQVGRKRAPIVDTWWQTETGAIMISPSAKDVATKPGAARQPLPGIYPVLVLLPNRIRSSV